MGKHFDYNNKCHWHLTKKHKCEEESSSSPDHHLDDESSSSSPDHHWDDESSSSSPDHHCDDESSSSSSPDHHCDDESSSSSPDHHWDDESSSSHCDDESSSHRHWDDESSSSSSSHCNSKKHSENCVKDVLKAILFAQKKAKEQKDCITSCQESINDLLGKSKKIEKNTIPFILYCGCKPFEATGVTLFPCHSKKKKFKCITSFIFNIKEIHGNCAILELLTFKSDHKCDYDYDKCYVSYDKECKSKKISSPCGQIDGEKVDNLIKTGICITVDLSCFCAITCLPAVRL